MSQWIHRCAGAWLCLGVLVAQDFEAGIETAQARIDAKEWRGALDVLLALPATAELREDHELLVTKFHEVGNRLAAVADFDASLRARHAELATLRRLHGDADHAEVARCLANIGVCLASLGRAVEALPLLEGALAMRKRLFADRDHADVAMSQNNLASCLQSIGRPRDALAHFEQSLAMRQRLFGERDHLLVAASSNNVASCLEALGRTEEALARHEQALAMRQRLCGDRDHADVAQSLNNVAACLHATGRVVEALDLHERALAMRQRLRGERDHPELAQSLNNVASCLQALGRDDEALVRHEQVLAMRTRLDGGRDHPDTAAVTNNLALCLQAVGRARDAVPLLERALAMRARLFPGRDHPDVAASLGNLAFCLDSLGRSAEALPRHEQALAMRRRLFTDRDHPDLAGSANNLAACLDSLGRANEALALYEEALAMRRRLHGDRDHRDVARSLNNLAFCQQALGRGTEALATYERALTMRKRLHGDRDHPEVAQSLNSVAYSRKVLGRANEALPMFEQALAMRKRIHGDRDHPDVARGLHNLAACLQALGRAADALPRHLEGEAMATRLRGDLDHPEVVAGLTSTALCLRSLGRSNEALPRSAAALAMIERLRDSAMLSPEVRQSLFEDLKAGSVFEQFQSLAIELGRSADALHAAERSRGRRLLDQLDQAADPEIEAARRARQRGDESTADRLVALRTDLEAARATRDRLLHELTTLAARVDVPDRDAQRAAVLARSNANSARLRQLLDERARLLADVLPVGRVRTPSEIQAALQSDELLLEFTVTSDVALLYVLAREGAVEAIELPNAFAATQRLLPTLLQRSSHEQLRGRDAEAGAAPAPAPAAATTELFTSLIPSPVWERVRKSRRVLVAAHRDLHRVPFEMLVTSVKDGKPIYWLDDGPPVGYVPSGTVLHWLRKRAAEAADDTTSLDLLAVGDPRAIEAEPPMPEQGVFVLKVNENGEGARIGLQPGDVLTSYDGHPLVDDKALRDARMETEKAIEDEKRGDAPIEIGVWRRGTSLTLQARPGQLGIEAGRGKARAAFEASLGNATQLERITRAGDVERLGSLPPLLGARAETAAIDAVFAANQARTKRLLGAEATEPAVFDLAAKAKYLHFACHGIAEEYAGQSLSMLVLSPPPQVLPGDDGLLELADLWSSWRGRLSSCRLVVLSACRTNVATTQRDEAPQALPLGFFHAGVPSVVSSLWAVDDQSTRELMTDFYGRLLAGGTDKLKAFTEAKKALRAKYPDPFHWAPFLFLGAPE